jgi:hypothetical protein
VQELLLKFENFMLKGYHQECERKSVELKTVFANICGYKDYIKNTWSSKINGPI